MAGLRATCDDSRAQELRALRQLLYSYPQCGPACGYLARLVKKGGRSLPTPRRLELGCPECEKPAEHVDVAQP